jgi:hypothetical protein
MREDTLRGERLEVSVTFDAERGYVATRGKRVYFLNSMVTRQRVSLNRDRRS